MLRLAADENFNNNILRGLWRRDSRLDILRVQDAGLSGSEDLEILAWAAHEDRVLLTHDVNTLVGFAYERIVADLPMPGVLAVPKGLAIAQAIEEILLLAQCSEEDEWRNQILFLPL